MQNFIRLFWMFGAYLGMKRHRFIAEQIQSTLVISKSKGPSKTVRDIRTSTYQICSIEEKNN